MKHIIALCACVLGVNVAAKAGDLAQALPPPPLHPGGVHAPAIALLPPYEAVAIVHSVGLRPLHRPLLHGASYLVRAVSRNGEEVRVVVDARRGRIVRIDPVMMPRYGMPMIPAPYGRPPGWVGYPHVAGPPPAAPPAPAMPPGAAPAPAVNAPPPSAELTTPAPLPRPRPKVAAAAEVRAKQPPAAAEQSARSTPPQAPPTSDATTGAISSQSPAPAEQQE